MSAFYSGTDNNDDKAGIRFSGVFGNLDRATPSTVWRFNYMDKKFDAKIEDIFAAPPKEDVEVPKEWLSRVVVSAPVAVSRGKPAKVRDIKEYTVGTGGSASPRRGKGSALVDRHSFYDGLDDSQGDFWGFSSAHDPDAAFARMVTEQNSYLYGNAAADKAERRAAWEGMLADVEGRSGDVREVRGVHIQDTEDDAVPVGASVLYETLAVEYGTDIADAYDSIDSEMVYLEGQDELLGTLASDMVGLLKDDAVKLDLMRSLYSSLGSDGREKLATTGF